MLDVSYRSLRNRALDKFQRKVLEEGAESRLYIELKQKIE
jgi:hypothetical protein